MRPKGKLLALVAMFAAVGLITATGAFTTVEAERTAEVDVAGDASALLAIDSAGQGDVDQVDGVAQLNLDDSTLGNAEGLNPDASTTTAPVLNLTNQGTQDNIELTVEVSVEDGPAALDDGDVTATLTQDTIDSGETAQMSLTIDLTGIDRSEFTDNDFELTIDITADQQ